ncbi:MAG: adenylate/guanylate cyclase domain-containing protein, partial [Alphaproteobacteria bacterium]|nr:adenylate/guanylate cyclase domain-containing protein [Alphaproteobacteria bacterium]
DRVFRHVRIFRNGPLKSFGPVFELRRDGDGTEMTCTLSAEPRNLLGKLLLRLGFLEKGGATIGRLYERAAAFVAGQQAQVYDYAPPALPKGAAERVAIWVAEIEAGIYGNGFAARLGEHLLTAQEVDLAHMRPIRLARSWGAEPRLIVELFFEAARVGLLKLSWDLLCPRCRGAKQSVASLDQLPTQAHCSSCNIAYGADFARNVELSFSPSPAVRELATGEYCLNGPHSTPHVVVQQLLKPGETRTLDADLAPGEYRLRTIEPGGEVVIRHDGDGFPAIVVNDGEVTAGDKAPAGTVRLENRGSGKAGIVIESRAWLEDALTAHRATTMQAFRDLLPAQLLKRDGNIAIESVTLMFTDLAGSTSLYERIGDGPAYQVVRDHFAFLADAVRRNNGTIVKTIGDAVMAAFSDPADGVRAALRVQDSLREFNDTQGTEPLTIKIGLHSGPCIAVIMNDRLDYFGSIANTAARLQGQSRGGDIVLSERLAADPVVAELLKERAGTREEAQLKGLALPVPFRRISGR